MRYIFEGMKKTFEVFNPCFKIRVVPLLYYCPFKVCLNWPIIQVVPFPPANCILYDKQWSSYDLWENIVAKLYCHFNNIQVWQLKVLFHSNSGIIISWVNVHLTFKSLIILALVRVILLLLRHSCLHPISSQRSILFPSSISSYLLNCLPPNNRRKFPEITWPNFLLKVICTL